MTMRLESGPEPMRFYRQNGLMYGQFPILSQFAELRHAVFTRFGGVSGPPFDSLNIGAGVGDCPECVRKNRQILSRWLAPARAVYCNQTHGDHVAAISGDEISATFPSFPEADALATDACNRALVIQTADCQSVMLYDPVRRVIGNVHSGWRGSIANVIGKAVQTMEERFGVDPKNIRAAVGPSLGPCCAEFIHYRSEIPRRFWSYMKKRRRFDFWSLSVDQLRAAGVPGQQIENSRLCTKCGADRFFSYRAEGRTGRFATVIALLSREMRP